MSDFSVKDAVAYAKRLLAYTDSRNSLIKFSEVITPNPNFPDDIEKTKYNAKKFHKVLANILERVERGEEKRIIITFPPRHGKTQLASKNFAAWYVGRNPRNHVLFATYNQTLAEDNGEAVRGIIKSQEYANIFEGVVLDKATSSKKLLKTTLGGTLQFSGRDGTITGRGGDLIVVDDILKGREDADSSSTRDKIWNWYKGTLSNRFMTDKGCMLIITTRWHDDDIVGRLTDKKNPHYVESEAKKWKIVNFTAIAEENDILGRDVGEALWPERFGIQYLEDQRALSPRDFVSLYQQRPSLEDGNLFKKEMFLKYQPHELPSNLRMYAASDHAVGIKQENDKTAMIVVGVDVNDCIWVVDVFWKKVKSDVQVEQMIKMMKKYNPMQWWGEPGQLSKAISPFLKKRMQEERVYVNVKEVSASGDKYTKAQSFYGRMSMGMVRWPKHAYWLEDAMNEMMSFPSGVHDDFVDACSMLGLGLNKMIRATEGSKKEKKGAAVGSLAWVKENSDIQKKQKILFNKKRGL